MAKKKELSSKERALVSINRQVVEDKETLSFLDYLSRTFSGRVPTTTETLENENIPDILRVEETPAPSEFINALRSFLNLVDTGQLKIDDVIFYGLVDIVRIKNKYYPGYQILVSKVTSRYETDTEVLARLKPKKKLAKVIKPR